MIFQEKILNCENFYIEQDYHYREGTKKVIMTSVHSMIHHKENGIKKESLLLKGL